jgi:hypothetical protein
VDFNLAPSSLTYLYEGCRRCFYLNVKHNIRQPSISLPQVFHKIDGLVEDYFIGRRTEDFAPKLPPGVVHQKEHWVQSEAIVAGANTYFIRGRFDVSLLFDTQEYGVIDFKTREEANEASEMYARQLQAYAWALENPAPGELHMAPVTRLAVMYLDLKSFELVSGERYTLNGPLSGVDIPVDHAGFRAFIDDLIGLLEGPLPAAQRCTNCTHCQSGERCFANQTPARRQNCVCCSWCNYRSATESAGIPI